MMERPRVWVVFVGAALALGACDHSRSPGRSYYEREIDPILQASCVGGVAPCHRDDGNGVALGNLDLSSFADLHRRPDVVRRHGSYPEPLLLIKAVASADLMVPYGDRFYPLEIGHAGGAILQLGGPAYLTLKQWLDNGATENGLPPVAGGMIGSGACSPDIAAVVDPAAVSAGDPGLAEFDQVAPFLVESCSAGTCHGSPHADFRLTCGDQEDQRRANYLMARAYVSPAADDSELLVRVLDPTAGGQWHAGGSFFASREDDDYLALREWAAIAGPLERPPLAAGQAFFEAEVMPVLLQRGCAMAGCHGPVVPHKLHLRAGSEGFISPLAADENYRQVHQGFVALASPDPRVSRLVAKNLIASRGGITHRGGPVLETPGSTAEPGECPQPYDPDRSSALCTIYEWLDLERQAVDPRHVGDLAPGRAVPLVWIERPPDAIRFARRLAFRPGADLRRADAVIGPGGAIESVGDAVSLLDGCAGLGPDRSQVDVRGPEISHDGQRVLLALRAGDTGFDVYEVGIDGQGCRRITSDGGEVVDGIVIDNLDPYYVTDDAEIEWVVYASTRGGPEGPTRTPKWLQPNTDLWRQPLAGGAPEQMTFLSGLEGEPAMMNNGQLIMTTEKATRDFYQIAGRRLNWDLSDYHPLLANRAENYQGRGGYPPGEEPADAVLRPSIDYRQATEIRQALDGNFLVVLADRDTFGEGGALGVFNRSIGPMEAGRDDPAFVASLRLLPGPTGRDGQATGAYRSPYPLPNGDILASFAAAANIGSAAALDYDLVTIDRITGERRVLVGGGGSQVEAVLAYPRPPPPVFTLSGTGTAGATAERALIHLPDLPLLATLLDSNNRRGRTTSELRATTRVRFFAHDRPPPACTAPSDPACAAAMSGPEQVYEARIELGEAAVAADGSLYAWLPAAVPLLFELVDGDGRVLFRLREEMQFGPFEVIGLGVPERSFDTMCAGCHGSVSGRELDIAVVPDVVSTASETTARAAAPATLE